MNVLAYIRVSTDGQVGEDKFGLDAQKEQITRYCIEKGHTILRWVADEGESGAKERPGFDSIVYGDVQNPPVEAVVVAKSDRVARDINIYYYYKMCLRKKDIDLLSVSEDFGQMGVFASMLEAFTLCVAQMERENITKRTTGGREMKAQLGGYSGGKPPFGYKVISHNLVINEDEAKVVRQIFALRREGMTMMQIRDWLNDRFDEYPSRSGTKYALGTVGNILHNEQTYRGLYKYGKNSAWVKGQQEPILTD